jgi:hypothetical protein
MSSPTHRKRMFRIVIAATVIATAGLASIDAQVRASRRGAVAKDGDRAAAVGPRGAAVKGEEGYAAAGRRGAVVSGEEGYAAVGRRGAVVTGEEVDVHGGAVGRRGAVVVGEEGAAAVGRYGGVVVSDNRYESYEAWRRVAAVGTVMAVGTMLAKPPAAATTVVVTGSTYYYHDNAYYTKVMNGGAVSYQVVAPPAGAIITALPANCQSVRVGNATYSQCGATSSTRVANGYQVVVLQ